jgi:hypothetical protein
VTCRCEQEQNRMLTLPLYAIVDNAFGFHLYRAPLSRKRAGIVCQTWTLIKLSFHFYRRLVTIIPGSESTKANHSYTQTLHQSSQSIPLSRPARTESKNTRACPNQYKLANIKTFAFHPFADMDTNLQVGKDRKQASKLFCIYQ